MGCSAQGWAHIHVGLVTFHSEAILYIRFAKNASSSCGFSVAIDLPSLRAQSRSA